jgi:hypothetical protein
MRIISFIQSEVKFGLCINEQGISALIYLLCIYEASCIEYLTDFLMVLSNFNLVFQGLFWGRRGQPSTLATFMSLK